MDSQGGLYAIAVFDHCVSQSHRMSRVQTLDLRVRRLAHLSPDHQRGTFHA
jgi:hypothetical protein